MKRLEAVHVLIMDNSMQVIDLFKRMLNELGFSNVHAATSGFEAILIMKKLKINLVITDWALSNTENQASDTVITDEQMLSLTGVDFVWKVRHSDTISTSVMPVIMLADAMHKMQVFAARDAGVNEICVKPLTAEKLCSRIISVIDHPRIFVTAKSYRGPCRRRLKTTGDTQAEDRRRSEICIIKAPKSARG